MSRAGFYYLTSDVGEEQMVPAGALWESGRELRR